MNIPDSVVDALARLRNDIEFSVRAELRTFKEEAIEQLRPLATAGALAAAAFLTVLAFIGVFSALCIIALSVAVAPWLAALIVTVIYGIVAASLGSVAFARVKSALPIKFEKTAQTVKEDVAWIKSDVKLRK
ncbi:MAG TPA: phage holin family protein [Candidatus Baltobacteraceae bacterium]|nr:phage holin family protein [Candidatus Baltobacteraceae bacterium]